MFDGLGHTISNLTINLPTTNNIGLFSNITSTAVTIRNVGLVSASISGLSNVGTLVGNTSGSIYNSFATGVVSGASNKIGGIVGIIGNSSVVRNIGSSVDVSASMTSSTYVGGAVGYAGIVPAAVANLRWVSLP